MTEEVKTKETEASTEAKLQEEVKVDPIIEKAQASGWMPKEEWEAAGKDPAKWRDATSWNDRGELFSEIERLKKELSQTNRALGSLKQHHLTVRENAFKEARRQLERELNEAKRNEDVTRILDLRDKIDELKEVEAKELETIENEPVNSGPAPEFYEWQAKNPWYKLNGKDAMSVYANNMAAEFVQEYNESGKSFTNKDVYDFVDKKMREEFPEKFKNPARSKPSTVEGTGGERPSSKGGGPKLTDIEEKICRDLVKSGVMTREQYIKELGKYEGA